MTGREVAEVFAGVVPAGGVTVRWDGRVSSGVYLARLVTEAGVASATVTVVR